MKRYFTKSQMLTIPNLLSVIRIALIPLIVWLYRAEKNPVATVGVILFSAATDVLDGWIARRFSMTSDFGKALDPLADKLTQGAILLCLLAKYQSMWVLIVVFLACELVKFAIGLIIAHKYHEVDGAKWYGKINTVVIYSSMIFLMMIPELKIVFAHVLMIVCGVTMVTTHVLYFGFYHKLASFLKRHKKKQ